MGIITPGNGGPEDWNINPTGTSINASYWDDDVYMFEYTAGATAENISMTIFSRNSWYGIGIFDNCTGTTFDTELDAMNNTTASTSSTVSATIAAGNTVYIAVGQWGAPNDLDFDVTDFTVTPIACADPTALSVSNITLTSADLGWTDNAGVSLWDIEWGAAPFTPIGTPTITGTTTNPHNLTGLTSGTSYEFYVRADCGGSGTSAWIGPFAFTTTPDYCAGDHFYDNGGAAGDYSNSTTNETTVICPSTPGDVVTATFNSFDTEAGWDDLEVFDGNGTGGTSFGIFDGMTIPGPFLSTDITGCLTFVFNSDGSGQRAGWDATITCAPAPTCNAPTALAASNITPTSADLGWTDNAGVSLWDIEWGAVPSK